MAGFGSLAEIEEMEKVPLADRNLPSSTYEVLVQAAKKSPTVPAVTFFLQASDYENSVSFTFSEWLGEINKTANMLHDLGVGPTDTVSYILPNLPQTYLALYGGEAAGIANPINPLLEPQVLADIMNHAKTKVLITLKPFPKTDIWEKVAQIADQVPTLETIIQVDMANYLGGIKKLVVKFMQWRMGNGGTRAKIIDFDATQAKYPSDKLTSGRVIKKDDPAAYFHTGGTTGTPKLAVHTHFNQVFDSWAAGMAGGLEENWQIYMGLPLFHNYGAIALGLGPWQYSSGVVLGTPSGFRGEGVMDNLWNIMAHYKCNTLGGVPTVFQFLNNLPFGGADLSNLSVATCGSAPLPVEVANQFTKKTGIPILEGYGLTESTSVASVNPRVGEPRIGSIGYRLPYQDMATFILDDGKFKRVCDPNEVGVVVLRGPNVMPGYSDDTANEGLFIDSGDGKGPWLNTGDMGRQDEDGYFWLTGRIKELIIRGGHNIDPMLIEEPMHEHSAVALAAAVGRPDARVGELPVVYVELKPEAAATEAELLTFAEGRIGERAAIPKQVYIIDEMPLTNVGKILKLPLAHAQIKDVYEAEVAKVTGVDSVDVKVEADKRLGKIAHISVEYNNTADEAAVNSAIDEALGQYSVHYRIQ